LKLLTGTKDVTVTPPIPFNVTVKENMYIMELSTELGGF